MKCYKFEGRTLTEEELFNKVKEQLNSNPDLKKIAAIVYKIDTPKSVIDRLKIEGEEAEKKVKSKSKEYRYIGVTDFISAIHVHGLEKKRLTPLYIEENRKAEFIKNNLDKYTGSVEEKTEEAEKAWNIQINSEKDNNTIGTHIHDLIHGLLQKDGINSREYKVKIQELTELLQKNNYEFTKFILVNDTTISKEITDSQKAKIVLNKLIDTAKGIVSDIKIKFGNDCTIYSEIPLVLKKKLQCIIDGKNTPEDFDGIFGRADLIVIDKDGKVNIVDYKVCSRPYQEWYDAKLNEVEYQIATYRAILADAGLDGEDIGLYIKPILFRKLDISSLQKQDFVNEQDASWKGASRISWRGGAFSKNLMELGIGVAPAYVAEEDTELGTYIDSDIKNIITYEDPKHYTKLWFIDNNKIEKDLDSEGNLIGYKFWSSITKKYIRSKNKEDFIKENGLIDSYIADLKYSRNEIARTISEEIIEMQKAKDAGKKLDKKTFLNSKGLRADFLQNTLGKYTDPQWRYENALSKELLDRGILIFSKQDGTEKIFEIVVIADSELSALIDIDGSTFVTGKYFSNEKAKQLDINVLESQYRNVKAVEVVSILNTIKTRHPNFFANTSIRALKLLNPDMEISESYGVNLRLVFDNFNIICKEANIENNLIDIKIPETHEYCVNEFLDVCHLLKMDDEFNMLFKDLEENDDSIALRKKTIERALRLMRDTYGDKVKKFATGGYIDISNPIDFAYLLLSQAYNDLSGKHVNFTGKIPKWAATPSEFMSMVQVLFKGTQLLYDEAGFKIVGLLSGMELTSPTTTPSELLQQINQYYELAYNNVRKEFNNETKYIRELTKEYVKKLGINLLIDGSNQKKWERLLVHNGSQISSQLLVKNPYDMSNDLLYDDREFLKEWLWEVNKYRMNLDSTLLSWHYKEHEKEIKQIEIFKEWSENNDGRYFELPLAKATTYQKTRATLTPGTGFGIINWFETRWKDFEDSYDPKKIHNIRKKQLEKLDIVDMYDNYQMSPAQRKRMLEGAHNQYEFSFDFDFLALDVAFQSMRKKHYDGALMLTETMLVAALYMAQTTGVDIKGEVETAVNLLRVVKGDVIMEPEILQTAKVINAARSVTSAVQISFRAPLFFKELVFGQFTNYSRAMTLKFGNSSNAIDIGNVAKATGLIWGLKFKVWGSAAIGTGTIADFNLIDELNNLYAIANSDMSRTSENAAMSRKGILNNTSRYMYLAQSAPDYYNRMTLFVAKMLQDGCYDAHYLDENKLLKYDWKKDKRFSELAKHGLNSDYHSPEYNKQKALYVRMVLEFEEGGLSLKKWNATKKRFEYGDIDQAYTVSQRNSIKEVADLAYGFYDRESKAMINHKFIGLFYLQFQTFISAKYNTWFKAPGKKGKNTAQGEFKEVIKDGIKYYDKHIFDEQTGKYIRTEIVPETSLTEQEKRECLTHLEWKGNFVEGLVYSCLYTFRDLVTLNFKELASNKQRLANVALAAHDLLVGILGVYILKFIFSKGTNKMLNIKPLQRVLIRGMQDVGPSAFTQMSLTPSFVSTITTLQKDGMKIISGSPEGYTNLLKHMGAPRDYMWEEP